MILACIDPAFGGGYTETAHGNPISGVQRIRENPKGSCGQCHTEKSGQLKFPKGLWRENDNELCYTCHRQENPSGIFPGERIYQSSTHSIDQGVLWPGPFPRPRLSLEDAGKCLNCHSPHGKLDRYGLIPSLLVAREENLCLSCHDGDPSSRNIAREITKPYAHAVRLNFGRHRADENGDPALYAYVGNNRHVECSDCHNAHALFGDPMPPLPPQASNRNAWVSRVRVINGGPGTIPQYDYLPAVDTSTPVLEYQICFKCHSSWTQQPPGQPDLARRLNPNNASHHPVESQGNNPGIDPNAFSAGMNAFSTILCSDCHGSEDETLRGPHGSQFPNILRQSYEADSGSRIVNRDELCFACHNFDVYANPGASPLDQQASRFNPPASAQGHAFHVGQQNVPCFACHDSHGSPQFGALIVTGRSPGLLSFNMNTNGGSCLATCHGSRSYSINYSR
jgi:predicted CXXCH cytochrome family protein